MDIFDFMDCGGCPHYTDLAGRSWGDPDYCYPPDSACADGDFGDVYPCERMLSRIADGLRDGDFQFGSYELIESSYLLGAGRPDYLEALAAWPDVDWSASPYWQIFYDERKPIGFDSAKEVCYKLFR
jgi:hypothetical protein